MSALSTASALTIATGSFLSLGPSSAQRADCSIRRGSEEATSDHLWQLYLNVFSRSSNHILYVRVDKMWRELNARESSYFCPEFKNKAVFVGNCLGLVEF